MEEFEPKRPTDQWKDGEQQPSKSPFNVVGWFKPSYYKDKGWISPDRRRDETKTKRRLERDPNHPRWNRRYAFLWWMGIKITLVGTDKQGRSHISIRKGNGEPIYIRFGMNRVELYRAGKKIDWDKDAV